MKRINIILATLILASSTMTSCYELDLYPHDKVSTSVFWKTEEHAKQGIMGVYDCMKRKGGSPTAGFFGHYYLLDALADVALCDPFSSMCNSTSTTSSGVYMEKWQNLYDGIVKANHALQNIPKIEATDEKKNEFIAEARFMRGLYYFHLLDFYGGVPIYDESWVLSETFDQMMEPRSTKEQVRAFILKDLDFAETHLPYTWSKADYGRATKAAAVALRGKVNLYAQKWEEAKSDFEKLVNDNTTYGCALNDDYAELFKPDTDANPEAIFFISNSGGVGDANDGMNMAFYLGTRSAYGGGWASMTLNPRFIDSYEKKDGTAFNWNDYIPGYNEMSNSAKLKALSCEHDKAGKVTKYPVHHEQIKAAFADRDPRLAETCITPYSFFNGWNQSKPKQMECVIFSESFPKADNGYIEEGAMIWYWFRKFVPEGDCGGQITNREHTPINFPLIRYADVLLMLAECYNELGDVDNAVQYINKVRERPSTNMPKLNSGASHLEARSKAEVHKRLMHERAVELAGEGVRYSDIRRWKVAETFCQFTATNICGEKRYDYKFSKERDYLWPIPEAEIEKNDKLKPNNPGW